MSSRPKVAQRAVGGDDRAESAKEWYHDVESWLSGCFECPIWFYVGSWSIVHEEAIMHNKKEGTARTLEHILPYTLHAGHVHLPDNSMQAPPGVIPKC